MVLWTKFHDKPEINKKLVLKLVGIDEDRRQHREYSNKMFSEEKFIDNANEILLKCIN